MSDEEEIILSTDNCEIKNSDISTLSPHTYLNDLIISFYYEILQKKISVGFNYFIRSSSVYVNNIR